VPLTINTERVYPGEARVPVAGSDSKATADQLMTADKWRGMNCLGRLKKMDTAPYGRGYRT
jgi:mRNA interferase MazF